MRRRWLTLVVWLASSTACGGGPAPEDAGEPGDDEPIALVVELDPAQLQLSDSADGELSLIHI